MKPVWLYSVFGGGRRPGLPRLEPDGQGRLSPPKPNPVGRSFRRTGVGLIVCGLLGMGTQVGTLPAAPFARPAR